MKYRFVDKWEKERKQGMTKFLINRFLLVAVPFMSALVIYDYRHEQINIPLYIKMTVILIPLSLFINFYVWGISEEIYKKKNNKH